MKKILLLVFALSSYFAQAQVMANPPDPLFLCDYVTPNDETEVFDLTQTIPQIIGTQTNVNVTFHLSSGDALGGQNAFPNPEAYMNIVNPQLIFVRVQSTAGQGSQITTLDIEVLPIAVADTDPIDLFIDEGDGDGIATFDLTVNEALIFGSQDPGNFSIAYFTSQADAEANVNAIAVPTAYVNTTNPQTIYVRFERLDNGCFSVPEFEIESDELLGVVDNDMTQVDVFPNPAVDFMYISSTIFTSEVEVAIYTIGGKRVISDSVVPNDGLVEIAISDLKAGLYFVQIASERNTIIKKLIKQ